MLDASPPEQQPRAICPACGYFVTAGTCTRCSGATRNAPDGRHEAPGRSFFLIDIATGFLAVFQGGAWLFTRPEYAGKLRWAILANLIAIPLVVVFLWLGLYGLFEWVDHRGWAWLAWIERHMPGWSWLQGVFTALLALLGIYLLLPVIVETVIAPFLEPIADATEKMLGGPRMIADPVSLTHSIAIGAAIGAKLLILQLCVLAVSLVFSFCGFGLPIALLASGYLSALVWFDIPFSRRGYPLALRARMLRANWAKALGFGLGFQVGLLVPLFNLIMLTPAAAVATCTLFLSFEKKGLVKRSREEQRPEPSGRGAEARGT